MKGDRIKLRCPKCGADTEVVDSRDKGDYYRRRRACKACRWRFNTAEITEISEKSLNYVKELMALEGREEKYVSVLQKALIREMEEKNHVRSAKA